MTDAQRLSTALNEALRPLMEQAHALGYRIDSVRLAPHPPEAPAAAFAGCTTECGPDENGHVVCKVHCP